MATHWVLRGFEDGIEVMVLMLPVSVRVLRALPGLGGLDEFGVVAVSEVARVGLAQLLGLQLPVELCYQIDAEAGWAT